MPGHGPIVGVGAVELLRDYLTWLKQECRERLAAGQQAEQAALDIELPPRFQHWSDPERIVPNVAACYRELQGKSRADDVIALFGAMGRWRKQRRLRL